MYANETDIVGRGVALGIVFGLLLGALVAMSTHGGALGLPVIVAMSGMLLGTLAGAVVGLRMEAARTVRR